MVTFNEMLTVDEYTKLRDTSDKLKSLAFEMTGFSLDRDTKISIQRSLYDTANVIDATLKAK